tara:strand:- start:262 stop:993 length:732 start_codon:yes stop_codon:yes gene_type:complete
MKNLNKIQKAVDVLKNNMDKSYFGPLDNYPARPSSQMDVEKKRGKSAEFIHQYFNGEQWGVYFAWHMSKESPLPNDSLFSNKNTGIPSKEIVVDEMQNTYMECLYAGEGNMLDRIGTMRSSYNTEGANPVAIWAYHNNIPLNEIYVMAFAIGKEQGKIIEKLVHEYREQNHESGKRFALAEYSASNGENGRKEFSIENLIMNMAYLKHEEAMKAFAKLEQTKSKAMGVHMSLYANEIIYDKVA